MKSLKRLVAMMMVIGLMFTSHTAYAAETYEREIYHYLKTSMGFNTAAACGVLANIKAESGFRTVAVGDHGTSYGICQWHKGRYTRLISYCEAQGLDYNSIDGQLAYLHYELKKSYPKVYNYLKSVDNSAEGAYKAAYHWCYYYEIPRTRAASSMKRGNTAKNVFYPKYANSNNDNTDTVTTTTSRPKTNVKEDNKLTAGTYEITSAAPVRKSPKNSGKKIGTIAKGTEVGVKTIKNGKWAKIKFNGETAYFSLKNAKKTSDSTSSASNSITTGSGSLKYPAGTYKATNKLPVHAKASAGSKVLGTIKAGTILKVSKVVNGKWSEVTYNGKTAYYSMKLTKKWAKSAHAKDTFGTKTTESASTDTYTKGTYKAVNAMPVRTAAKKTAKQFGTLKKGTLVAAKVIKNGAWAKISYNGKTAYVSLKNAKKYSTSTRKGKTRFTGTAEKEESNQTFTKGTYKLTRKMTLRNKAAKTGKYLAEIKAGTKVKVKAVKNKKWGKVTYKGKSGYISLKYATKL